jgi:hypothetical protein
VCGMSTGRVAAEMRYHYIYRPPLARVAPSSKYCNFPPTLMSCSSSPSLWCNRTQGGIPNGGGVGWWQVGVSGNDMGKPGGSGMRDESSKVVNSAGGGVGVRAWEAEKRDLDRGSSSESEASMGNDLH